RSSRLLHGLRDDVVGAAVATFKPRMLRPQQLLMQAQRACPGVLAIDDGAVEVVGMRVVHGRHLLGEMALLPANVVRVDVVALTSTTGLFASTRSLAAVARRFPELRARIDKLSVCRRAFDDRWRPEFATSL